MFHSDETVEDTSNATPIVEEALSVKESHRNMGSQDSLEVSPSNGEPQDKITHEEHISSHNSPAEVENVTLEDEEVKEDSAAVVVYEEVFEVHTEVETLKQGDKQVLRQTTIFSTKTIESIQQKSDKETNENTLQTIDIVGELAVTDPDAEESQVLSDDILVMAKQLKDEELQNEELTGNKHEFGVKDAILQEISSEHPDTAETRGHLLAEKLTHEEEHVSDHMSDDETEESAVVQRRGRQRVNPLSTKHRQHKEEGEHTHEAEPIAGRSLGRKEADEKPMDKQLEDQHQEETDQSMDRTPETSAQELLVVEDGRTPGAQESQEDAITSTKVRIEINKDITEMLPEMDSEKQELTDDGNEETGALCGDILDQPTASVPDELQLTKDCEIQQARVILVDLKTGSDYVSLMAAGETIEVQCFASEREEMELTADEKMDEDPETALQPSTEEENDDLEEVNGNKGKEDSSNENHEEEEEEPFIETIFLRSGRKIIKVGHQEHQHDARAAVSTGDNGEIAGIENRDKSVDQRKEKNPKAEVKVMDDPSDQAMAVAGSETCPNEQAEPSEEVSEINISAEVESQTEKETPVPANVDEGPVTLSEDQENTDDSTSPDTVQASNLEEPFRASKEKPHSEEMNLQESDLHRVTVVVVELRNSSQLLYDNTITDSSVAEEQPAVEMEEALREDGQTEAAPDLPVKASSVSEEAITTQNKQSAEEDDTEGVSGAEETPVLERRVLRSGRKTGNIRSQRKGRGSAADTTQGKSKRAQTKEESAEQETDETIPTLEELTEEPKTDLEDVPQKEPSKEQDVQEENAGVGVAQEEEEEMQLHCEEADETSQDEPASIGSALRMAKRSAPAASTHKSKRSCMQRESEEETSAADREVEDTKTDDSEIAEIENADKSVDQLEKKLEDMGVVSAEATTGTNSERHSKGEKYFSETASAPVTVVEGYTDENEAPAVATHVCGSNRNTINASAGTILLNVEETRETHSGPDESEQRLVIHAEEQIIAVPEGEEEELAEETTSLEKVIKIDGARDQIIGSDSVCRRGAESENFNDEPPVEVLETGSEVYGTSRGNEAEITELDVEPPTAAPRDHLLSFDEEAPTVTSSSQKSRTKRPKTTPKRTSRRWKKQGLVQIQQHIAESGDDKTQEKPEDPGEISQPHEPSGFINAKDLEESDMEESMEGDVISVESEKDISSNSELNADEDGKEFNLEVGNNLSDDDGELIVTGEKVLRSRTVPALAITPQKNPKSRRHRIEEFLSEEEKTPQLALKKKPLKRKGTEATPGRKSKRCTR